jgi:pyridoxamine 5'-phosphate oxidase
MAPWLQLATVATDGKPRVRTLVFRGWGNASHLNLFTDGCSAKLTELQGNPGEELGWLLAQARCQFRLRAQVQILPAELLPMTHVPDNGVLLRIAWQQVELLDLNTHPHNPRRWWASDGKGWSKTTLNRKRCCPSSGRS